MQDDWKITPRLTLNLGSATKSCFPSGHARPHRASSTPVPNPAKPVLITPAREGSDRYNRAMIATDSRIIHAPRRLRLQAGREERGPRRVRCLLLVHGAYGDGEWLVGNPPDAFGVTISSSADRARRDPRGRAAAGRARRWPKPPASPSSSIERRRHHPATDSSGTSTCSGSRARLARSRSGTAGQQGNASARTRYRRQLLAAGAGKSQRQSAVTSRLVTPGNRPRPFRRRPHLRLPLQRQFDLSRPHRRVEKRFSTGLHAAGPPTASPRRSATSAAMRPSGTPTGCGFQDTRNLRAERSLDNMTYPIALSRAASTSLPFGKDAAIGSRSAPRSMPFSADGRSAAS